MHCVLFVCVLEAYKNVTGSVKLLSRDLDYKAYNIKSVEDLTRPFVSMYFGAAYMSWLANYEGRLVSLSV